MKTSPSPPPSNRLRLTEGRALVLAGIVLSALNLRTAVTSITPLLDELGRVFGFGGTMAGVLGMLPSAAFAVFGVATPTRDHPIGIQRNARREERQRTRHNSSPYA